ncbi:MAG: UDP-glucose--hexose-1-phosphate uridylyltransferase [Bacilli bacterium]|jgi:UDPglucose--hexose-1-phosphate uridylyltransferase
MIARLIEKLLAYAAHHLYLDNTDKIYVRNILLRKLKADAPYEGAIDERAIAAMEVPDALIEELRDYLLANLHFDELKAELFIEEIMGDLTPLPSKVIETFWALYDVHPEDATNYFYDLCIKSNYIRKTSIDRNIKWLSKDGLEISINLSKPEKDNRDIRKLAKVASTGYPKCVLCLENLGYQGRSDHPARETLRVIPLEFDGEPWFWQFSPYGYYDEHLIVISDEHAPMKVSRANMSRLFRFVDLYPHFFIGSNSDLPITGGSILTHEHFQGGRHVFPMMKAQDAFAIPTAKYENVRMSYLDFYNSAFKLVSKDAEALLDVATHLNERWQKFEDQSVGILPNSDGERHSSLTSIVTKHNDLYTLYLIVRNNRCDERYPDGIFHAHPEYHHIKKEGIGLIEAMGLFILPPRLKRQSALIGDIVANNISTKASLREHPDLEQFVGMIDDLKAHRGADVEEDVRDYIGEVCKNILINTSVFKKDEQGQAALRRFIETLEV